MGMANDSYNVKQVYNISLNLLQSCETLDTFFKPSEFFVSNEARKMWEVVVDLGLAFIIANVGIVSNIIIIVVFAKQGYKESMNVSMTAIAIWDLIKCLGGSLQRMAGPVSLADPALGESWTNISVVVNNYLNSFASYVSSVLAAYVAVERCLCVSVPFMVKVLLTPRTTFIAMTSMSIIVFGCFAVIFGIYEFYCVYSPQWNQTVIAFRYNDFFRSVEGPLMSYYNLSGVIWPAVSFGVIVFCTTIIVIQLQKSSKFRSSSKTTDSSTISSREKQVVKMLVVIIAIYIVNLSPRIALYMGKYFVYDLYFLRKYHNLFMIMCYILIVFDLTNATANLFVFVTMSSNFKATAKELFNWRGKKVKS